LAKSAQEAGLDGIVCSPLELHFLKQHKKPNFVFVTPGIRNTESDKNDQARTMTAREALTQGADYLVIGRPIIAAPDPAQAAQNLTQEIYSQQNN
jgi:orotidine-5'-phosphate decarboxylase